MRQSEVISARREREKLESELLQVKRLNGRYGVNTSKRTSKPRTRKPAEPIGPPSNMQFLDKDALVDGDSPIMALFSERVDFRESSRSTAHKARRNRNDEAIASAIRTPRNRTRNDFAYGTQYGDSAWNRSKRPA